jgi:hypothetical protein
LLTTCNVCDETSVISLLILAVAFKACKVRRRQALALTLRILPEFAASTGGRGGVAAGAGEAGLGAAAWVIVTGGV